MRWGDVQLQTSADGTEVLEYTERQTKPERALTDTRTVKPKIFLSRLYASKRPEQINSEESPFYLAVNLTKMANSSKPWLKAPPMGVNKLNSLMKTTVQKAG